MKKYILFMGGILLCCVAGAQGYMNICSPGKTLFSCGTEIKGFRYDSLSMLPGGDTLFMSFPAVRDTGGTCLDTTGGSVLCRRIIRCADGQFLFFTFHHDTIRLKTQAGAGETWRFLKMTQGNYLQATVTGFSVDTVAGVTDSVKIITFQAKDPAGNNIPGVYNSKDIHLGKTLGFTKVFDLFLMPRSSDTAIYILSGKSHPASGLQELTVQEIFDYDTGDVFQFTGDSDYGETGSYDHDTWHETWNILDKVSASLPDQVTYQVHSWKLTKHMHSWEPTYDALTDTVRFITCDLSALAGEPYLTGFPDEYNVRFSPFPANNHRYYWEAGKYNQRFLKGLYSSYQEGDCYAYYPYRYMAWEFVKGLGQTYNFSYSNGQGSSSYKNEMTYFKKGNESWGTLVPLGTGDLSAQSIPEVYPNPTTGSVKVRSAQRIGSVQVFNPAGVLLQTIPVNDTRGALDLSGKGKGVFILRFMDGDHMINRKIVVL